MHIPTKAPDISEFFIVMERAREIDPAAWKPVMMPHYTDQQKVRQDAAMHAARAEVIRNRKSEEDMADG